MTFRGRIFLALSLVGLVPLALLGWQSFVLNRAELETTVVGAQAALARSAAQGAEKWVAQTVEQLRLAVGYLPYDRLSQSELAAVLRIPFRQLRSVMVLVLLDVLLPAKAPGLSSAPGLPVAGS